MEHEVWQIRQHNGSTEPPLIDVPNDDAMENVHLPISAAQYHSRALLDQFVEDEHVSENTTFFVNMSSSLSEKDHKRLVRSQAMKAYHAKRRRKAASEEGAQPIVSMSLDYGRVLNSYTQDPFVSFPIEMAPTTRDLLHNVFTDPRTIIETYRHIQFGNGLNCEAAFYQTLANIANWTRLIGGTSDSMKGYMHEQEIQHTTKALSLVRQMLLDPKEQLGQGVVSAVTHLITYAIMNNDMVAAAYHLDGLERIITLRGGFETLDLDVQGCISWGEVFLATTWDSKPRFIAPANYYKTITAFDAPLTPGSIAIIKNLRQRCPSLATHIDLFEQVTRLNNIYQNEILNHRTLTPSDGNVHSGICYHLASIIQPIDFDNESVVIGEIIRLALFIYLQPAFGFLAGLSSSTNSHDATPQLKKLRVAMELNEIDWGKLITLKAWAVVMGFLNAVEADDILFWSRLWVKTLHKLENRRGPSILPIMELGQTEESITLGCLSLYVPKAVTSVIWLEEFHSAKYREVVSKMLGY